MTLTLRLFIDIRSFSTKSNDEIKLLGAILILIKQSGAFDKGLARIGWGSRLLSLVPIRQFARV